MKKQSIFVFNNAGNNTISDANFCNNNKPAVFAYLMHICTAWIIKKMLQKQIWSLIKPKSLLYPWDKAIAMIKMKACKFDKTQIY